MQGRFTIFVLEVDRASCLDKLNDLFSYTNFKFGRRVDQTVTVVFLVSVLANVISVQSEKLEFLDVCRFYRFFYRLRGALRFVNVALEFGNLHWVIAERTLRHIFQAEIIVKLEFGGLYGFAAVIADLHGVFRTHRHECLLVCLLGETCGC